MSLRLKPLLPLLALLFLAGCGGGNYTWGWHVVSPFDTRGLSNLQFLMNGVYSTISVALVSITLSVMLGLIFALPALSSNRLLAITSRIYVEFFRAVPMLVLILWVYYGVPVLTGLQLSVFFAGVIALALCDSAFEAEIFRAGLQSIDAGQREAADALGLSYMDKLRFIILPQAVRRVLPPLGNQFVYMLKASSLLSVIGYSELTRRANELVVVEYRPLEIYSLLVLEYLVLILFASWGVRTLERRLARSDRAAARI
ncbi:amino acid ABC transporter permease [Roseovarius sp. ZX-A-9]|uniref:amino acid ABC transporter permease n=1 Tax=Roseovarius sp. ZX-A-9 TaxID=3014783 RepID=UPI00232E84A7|nr:amino acid ABC transporter permease [Roseovarius sp. ZX-A-9]